jgi:hypothetical protein
MLLLSSSMLLVAGDISFACVNIVACVLAIAGIFAASDVS